MKPALDALLNNGIFRNTNIVTVDFKHILTTNECFKDVNEFKDTALVINIDPHSNLNINFNNLYEMERQKFKMVSTIIINAIGAIANKYIYLRIENIDFLSLKIKAVDCNLIVGINNCYGKYLSLYSNSSTDYIFDNELFVHSSVLNSVVIGNERQSSLICSYSSRIKELKISSEACNNIDTVNISNSSEITTIVNFAMNENNSYEKLEKQICDLQTSNGDNKNRYEIFDEFEFNEKGLIGYKQFGLHYHRPGKWVITPGSIIEHAVNLNRDAECSYGINIGSKNWITQNGKLNIKTWKMLIEFRDFNTLVIPENTDGKIRCGRATILEELDTKEFFEMVMGEPITE